MDGQITPVRHMVEAAGPIDAKCPVEVTIFAIDGKWKAVLLWHLTTSEEPLRFGELRRRAGDITQRMLSRQLREMEASGLIWRDVYPVVPARVEYGLTARGRSLRPVLEVMCAWGKDNGWTGP